jgi:uncharacterized phiE125 gp8 family phage protein
VRVEPDVSDEDDFLRSLILVVRDWAEGETSKALLTQTLALHLDCFPCSQIYLPRPPLQSVSSITYLDSNGTLQTLVAVTDYQVVGARTTPDAHAPCGYVQPAYGESWPATYPVPECVTITYKAGWLNVEAVPQRIKQAMLLTLADLYAHRETVMTGTIVNRIPLLDALLANERCHREFSY